MSVFITLVGKKQAQRFLKNKEGDISSGFSKGLTKATLFMQGEVKESIAGRKDEPTSVDTGRYLNSVDIKVGKDDAMVFSDVPYSQFLEFGTSKFTGRKHFNNSKARNKGKIKDLIRKEILKRLYNQ